MKILIVDDDIVVRKFLYGIVQSLGHKPIGVDSGEEALLVLEEQPGIQLILLDWLMPGLSGIEVCKRIREESHLLEKYIIFLTIKVGSEDMVEALSAGANDYIKKPVDRNELKARLGVGVRTIQLQNRIRELEGLMPICGWCKSIRNDKNYWESIEEYLSNHSQVTLTHGICPDCKQSLQSELKAQ